MGLRFRRSWSLIPGVRLNLGLRSGSVSFGMRGLHYTVGTRGSQVTAGLPGTGLFWTKKLNSPFGRTQPQPLNQFLPAGGGAQRAQSRQRQGYLPRTPGGAQQPQSRQPQTYSPPASGRAQSLFPQPNINPGGVLPAVQLVTPQVRVQNIGRGNQLLPATNKHVSVPLWVILAVLAVIAIAGLCMVATMIGQSVH
jgi:hypothetical protein